jgi:hypothetical protein
MGSPPPDRDPRPKLALTSAPDPNAQIQQVFYCFIGECFLKNSNPNYTDHERKGKNTFNFFSENWVSQGTSAGASWERCWWELDQADVELQKMNMAASMARASTAKGDRAGASREWRVGGFHGGQGSGGRRHG